MQQLIPDNLTFHQLGYLILMKKFAKEINLADIINTMVKIQMHAVLAMVLGTLLGRTPFYRLKEFFHKKDKELLLCSEIDFELFL